MCSLEEAYPMASFPETPRRRSAPRRPMTGPGGASAEPFAVPPHAPADRVAAPADRVRVREPFRQASEPFRQASEPPSRAAYRSDTEHFVGASKDTATSAVRMGDRDKITYQGMANDYVYYNQEYGLGLPKFRETFTNSLGPKGVAGSCGSIAPQRYEIPISPEAKKEYDAAFLAALEDNGPQQTPNIGVMRRQDLDGVGGYEDEDLAQYMQYNDISAAPLAPPPRLPQPPAGPAPAAADPAAETAGSLVSLRENPFYVASSAPAPSSALVGPSASKNNTEILWEIALFVIAGLLVIFLCEQLFKLAILLGMRRTMELMEPFLEKMTK